MLLANFSFGIQSLLLLAVYEKQHQNEKRIWISLKCIFVIWKRQRKGTNIMILDWKLRSINCNFSYVNGNWVSIDFCFIWNGVFKTNCSHISGTGMLCLSFDWNWSEKQSHPSNKCSQIRKKIKRKLNLQLIAFSDILLHFRFDFPIFSLHLHFPINLWLKKSNGNSKWNGNSFDTKHRNIETYKRHMAYRNVTSWK